MKLIDYLRLWVEINHTMWGKGTHGFLGKPDWPPERVFPMLEKDGYVELVYDKHGKFLGARPIGVQKIDWRFLHEYLQFKDWRDYEEVKLT